MYKKLIIRMLKYYPIIVNVYIAIMMMGYITHIISSDKGYTFIGQCFYMNAFLFLIAPKLGFCTWYRVLVISMSLVLLIETFYNYGYELNYYLYICAAISIVALITSVVLIVNGRLHKGTVENTKGHSQLGR